jgi:hypothetical protein
MAYAFGTLIERLPGATIHFIPDGTTVSSVVMSATAAPALAAFTSDYTLGRISSAKYTPKTKDRTREWALETGGYKERTTKITTEDAFEATVIDCATALVDQFSFGLETAPAANTAQQAFVAANRYKDGWILLTFIEEDGTESGKLRIHARLELNGVPEIKNEDASYVWRVAHLADAGNLDQLTPYPA